MVNVPVIFIMLSTIFIGIELDCNFKTCLIIAFVLGWVMWELMMKRWVEWGKKNDIDKERLFKLGKIGFINFYRSRVFGKDKN